MDDRMEMYRVGLGVPVCRYDRMFRVTDPIIRDRDRKALRIASLGWLSVHYLNTPSILYIRSTMIRDCTKYQKGVT